MSVEFRVHGYRFEMPPGCACCLAWTEERRAVRDGADPHGPMLSELPKFPWCERCQQHARYRRLLRIADRVAVFAGPVLIGVAFIVSVVLKPPVWAFITLAILAAGAAVSALFGSRRLQKRLGSLPGCSTGDEPVQLFREGEDAWRVGFHNGDFARQFVKLNMPEGPALGVPREGALFPQSEAPGRGLLAASEHGRKRTFLN